MPAEGVLLGPFTGGLNTASDPSAVQNNDLTVCQNMELDLDGALTNRPPIVSVGATLDSAASGNMEILGYYTSAAGVDYLVGTNGNNRTAWFDGTSWQTIANIRTAAVCQYRDKLWLIVHPASSDSGGSWDPIGGFTVVAGLPKGQTAVTNKERIWVGAGEGVSTNGARLTYCAVGDPLKWPDSPVAGGGYFNVNTGDGQNVVCLLVSYSDILVFKERSTYRFSFSTDPANGTSTRISETIGASGKNCVSVYENAIYVLFDDKVYSLVNYNYNRINIKVPLKVASYTAFLSAVPYILSVWADRLFVQYMTTTYVYSLRTQTWSTWTSAVAGQIGRLISMPNPPNDVPRAFLISNTPRNFQLYQITDSTSTDAETMECVVRTKILDYEASHLFKKLMWWGAAVSAKANIEARVAPVVYALPVTWGDLRTKTWGELNTWGRPLDRTIDVSDSVSISSAVGERKFLKFLKTLRFRQIYFELKFMTNGSTNQAPAKLFTLTTFVTPKQIVSQKVS